jgi:hypothetical protein
MFAAKLVLNDTTRTIRNNPARLIPPRNDFPRSQSDLERPTIEINPVVEFFQIVPLFFIAPIFITPANALCNLISLVSYC